MKKYFKQKKGFTLIEVLVVVIILGILAAVAVPYYGRAIERMRAAEVLVLIGTELASQERNMLMKHRLTNRWDYLDAAPVQITPAGTDNDYFNNGRTVFYTRGGFLKNGENDSGYSPSFKVYFDNSSVENRWFVVAERIGWGGYKYKFVRDFEDKVTICIPDASDENSVLLCTDFMGVSSPEELPPDPRTAA